jgi:EamA domain-containing membrane protein RarD
MLGYLVVCLSALVGGLVLQASGVSAGGWIAIAALVALIPVFHPLPDRGDLPWIAALIAVLAVGGLVLKAIDA